MSTQSHLQHNNMGVELPKKIFEFIIPHQIFFKNYAFGEGDIMLIQTLRKPFFKVELTQEELNQKY